MIDKLKTLFNNSENGLKKFIESNHNFKLKSSRDSSFITISKMVKIQDIEALLEKLWFGKFEVAFHDTIHPTLSDPGAYFSYSTKKSEKKNVWSMTYGNHGWSDGIYHLNKETLANQITNLIRKTSMNEIQITNVTFFSHYILKDEESSMIKNSEILEMHNKN